MPKLCRPFIVLLPIRRLAALAASGFAAANLAAAETVTIPYDPRDGRICLPARVNGRGPLTFLLDTGYELTMLNPPHARKLGLEPSGGVTIVGVAGEERADMFRGVTFDLGGAEFRPRRVASLPSDERRRGRDGVLGSAFFRRFIVEFDAGARRVRLHEPQSFQYAGRGEIIPLTFDGEVPVIETGLVLGGGTPVGARLKLDTGCDGGVCLGNEFIARHGWRESGPGRDTTRSGVGGGARTRQVELAEVHLGRLKAARVASHWFSGVAPGDERTAGHLGAEVLMRYRVIFDYRGKRLILEELSSRP